MKGNIYDNLGIEQTEESNQDSGNVIRPEVTGFSPPNSGSYNSNRNQTDSGQDSSSEVSIQIEQIQLAAQQDLDFLAALATPLTFRYKFPVVYIAIWQWLLNYVHKTRDFSQLALGLPRGFAKTSLIKLFILYCILFTQKKFIAVMSENQTKAQNIISDVIDMLTESNIIKSFGDWRQGIETNNQDVKKFGFRGRNIILMATTVGTIRGITLKNERPDVMIFDDIQSREMAETQTVSENLEREMIGTAMKAKSPHGCLFVFVANMYPTQWSILRKLKTNANWIKFIAGGILEDGSSLWEELQPIEQLKREFLNDLATGHPEIFYSEVLNDENANVNTKIDLSLIPPNYYVQGDIAAGKFVIIDPATDKPGADAVSVGYFEVHNTHPMLMELEEGSFDPEKTIHKAIAYCLKYGCTVVAIESNAYQYSLKFWFEFICRQMQLVGITAVEVYSGHRAKNIRILEMFKSLLAGTTTMHDRVKSAVHLQITQFNAMKKDNTDGLLDLLTYAPKVIELYENLISASSVIDEQDYAALEVIEFNSAF